MRSSKVINLSLVLQALFFFDTPPNNYECHQHNGNYQYPYQHLHSFFVTPSPGTTPAPR